LGNQNQDIRVFVDAAHFVLAPFLGFLWSAVRLFIRVPAGRQRFNVLGVLNAITHELIAVTNDTYITSKEAGELLERVLKAATQSDCGVAKALEILMYVQYTPVSALRAPRQLLLRCPTSCIHAVVAPEPLATLLKHVLTKIDRLT